ncbi:uncharacterized protein LOC142567901 [Dermacentor variabilis]|uniref:uncharacterized protein LOC142567901 n=1 Tax=Dermacentor variabilis TaxID=34621 RepID=UPI003F5C4346
MSPQKRRYRSRRGGRGRRRGAARSPYNGTQRGEGDVPELEQVSGEAQECAPERTCEYDDEVKGGSESASSETQSGTEPLLETTSSEASAPGQLDVEPDRETHVWLYLQKLPSAQDFLIISKAPPKETT